MEPGDAELDEDLLATTNPLLRVGARLFLQPDPREVAFVIDLEGAPPASP